MLAAKLIGEGASLVPHFGTTGTEDPFVAVLLCVGYDDQPSFRATFAPSGRIGRRLRARSLVRWSAGSLVRWSARPLVRWSAGWLVRWVGFAPSGQISRRADGCARKQPLDGQMPPLGDRFSRRRHQPGISAADRAKWRKPEAAGRANQPLARRAAQTAQAGRGGLWRLNQLPELLNSLAEATRVASIAASNAIENITVAPNRVERMAKAGEQRFRNRNEREFAGYRDAIDEITRGAGAERISVPFILHLHRQLYRHVDGRGGYLKTEPNLIVSHEEGRRRILFEPPPPEQTDFLLTELVDRYNSAADAAAAHPLLLIAAFCLDLLAIHPVANGNGRLSRLLTTHLLLQRGYGVPRFSSVERRIFETKSAYYEALEESQRGWHEARHDVWPWVDYLTAALADAYVDFEAKVLSHRNLVGLSKQDRVRTYVLQHANVSFQINDIRRALPGVSDPTIRIVLRALIHEGQLMIDGLGREATYAKTGLPDSAGG